MQVSNLPRALSDDFKAIINEAQENCKKRKAADDTITCPFLDMSALRIGNFPWGACRVCHAWMGTDPTEYGHPCNALTYLEVRKIFWREAKGDRVEYCINDIMAQVRICLQSVISGNKKMVSENEAFKITVYQMGTLSNIRIDIKEND
jgi:hypothetical protein